MGRKKFCPSQAGKVDFTDRSSGTAGKLEDSEFSIVNGNNDRDNKDSSKLTYIDVDTSNWDSDEHLDIAEIVLADVRFSDGTVDYGVVEDSYRRSNFCLRICLCDVEEGSFRLGQWPSLSSSCIFLEYLILDEHRLEDMGTSSVLFSGTFDGPGESVSGLAHLVSLKFLTLRLIVDVGDLVDVPSFRVRVEILNNAFDACESLLETARKPWKKSVMNVMSWLRPEVISSEAVYGTGKTDVQPDGSCKLVAKNDTQFDTADFYEAIKPSREEPVLEDVLPDLLPHLRPYQRRATYWMVQREKGVKGKETELPTPYCVPVDFLHKNSRMFYNPFSGNVSLIPESSLSYVYGGILADEMGLGKTVELLACIFAHRKTSSEDVILSDGSDEIGEKIKIQKLERVECICGAASESSKYKGLWVQCDLCDAWQHAECVGYSPNKKDLVFNEVDKRGDTNQKSAAKKNSSTKSKHCMKKKDCHIIESDGEYICSLCLQLIEAAKAKIYTRATLVVCPAPILVQWHSEIIRHTRPGSLRICIYEGARNLDSSDKLKIDMTELVTADIVLTTYDVLKEDLSHDPDKEGADRHFLRFQKRYPVVPTFLTKIHWWRLCLDEAQMVESSKACVTEMAMRLHAQHRWCITGTPVQRRLDDLYGLLRFLRVSPFDVYRWWVEVIRDPYERRDIMAMKFIQNLFRQIMWRSSKIHVSEELQLPPQEECISWLSLSPIEEHFYQKQHATCVNHAHAIIKKLKDDNCGKESPSGSTGSSSVLPHSEVAKLLVPLLKLRQACCHPQVGSSGLCSLQNSPLSMGEILEVLIGKAKIEGEEELRKIVVALNGLAGIAVIDQDNKLAISLYKEALVLADENCDDFRLDPLLNLHLNHNLAELLRTSSEYLPQCPLMEAHCIEDDETKKRKTTSAGKFDYYYVKRKKTNKERKTVSTTENISLKSCRNVENATTQICTNGDSGKKQVETSSQCQASARCYSDGCLRKTCEKIKQKYLSMFNAKLSLAQQEFQTILMQVSTISQELEEHKMNWWLDTLDHIEQNNDSSEELLRKIDDACTRITNEMGSKRIASRVRSISMLKYTIESGVDSLQSSRKKLIDRLMEVNQMMEKPTDDDLESQRYCPNCYDGNGSLCVQCELDKHFRVYEAQLFLVKRSINDTVIASVEEALNLQNRYYELNHFFRNKMTSDESHVDNGKNKQRSARESVQVYRHPSALETSLKVIRSHSKSILGRKGMGVAKKHLLLFEAMRKEFTQARLLSIAQTQLLRAHDEIQMSTSRLRLKESEDEPSAINILIKEELVPTKFQLSTDKILSLSSLERIKGQLRYLKGMMLSKQKTQNELHNISHETRDTINFAIPSLSKEETEKNIDDEPCPVCQERYFDQKMVFQCGHFICCKCCLHMSERAIVHSGKSRQKWITCPTCRHRTEFENIAYVVEKQNRNGDVANLGAFRAETMLESSIVVQGSYGTKIEAVTRRILWIILKDQEAKILVFSSWNDVLDVLEHALVSNSITYVRMKGGRKSQVAIAQFKGQRSIEDGEKAKHPSNEKSVQVILMLIQHGANGLNLLEAQHVILVEPLLNPAAEAQAISRIHRVGQDKNTFVHRFIVKNTIEESIYMLNSRRAACSTVSRKAKSLKDEPVLTLQDVESLFPVAVPAEPQEEENNGVESLRHLPPSVAAGLAAERRFVES